MSLPLVAIGIQCRLTSSRLPCKALLKLADTTVLGMCIQRAKHAGHPVFLLTSDQREDDILVNATLEYGADGIIRGSLDNVLSRYLRLIQDFPCEYIIRVTADNPLTEYEFVNPLIDYAYKNGLPYAWVESSLCPEGTNIEIFSKEALFESVNTDISSSNLEHVTTFMRRSLSSSQCLKDVASQRFPFDCKQLSFTIDTILDYVKIVKLIDSVNQRQGVCWKDPNFVRVCAEFALNGQSSYPLRRNHGTA
ncbi:hypothetical protein KBY71_12490 [Cyanobium sp. T1B-Tous]|uniref:cytidylyltransferase domain-containing protein n=1 Tax=Cyanobium sp. T1B-Tous TaxID=2823721 RepID=UPI0020CC8AFE|nr:hypothetical protein [Cyanobium sp. T1B-Tous]MCP9807330.1 hypothetical protein [Cyanobium sp. T1B-Tous]